MIPDATALYDLRVSLDHDPHRPHYHFCAPLQWLNDPNGLFMWRGQLHLFYQHHPFAAVWGQIHWGHAVSADLVHWRDLPIALMPDPGLYDADGCWSGCTVVIDGVPTIYYTSVYPQTQSIAFPVDLEDRDLTLWIKDPANPILAHPPEGLDLFDGGRGPDWRDPFVWHENGAWWMVIGVGLKDVGGAALLYRSEDGRAWEYLHPLAAGSMSDKATIWECPNFFALNDAYVLIVSELPGARSAHVQIGAYTDLRFHPRTTDLVDHGSAFYAPQTTLLEDGRRLMFGWLKESRPIEQSKAAGWSGAMTVPRVLSVRDDKLVQTPAPELAALRESALFDGSVALTPGESVTIAPDTQHAEILLTADADSIFALGVLSSGSGDDAEEVLIDFDSSYATLLVSTTRASLDSEIPGEAVTVPFTPEGKTITLRVFVDGSIVEVFADDRVVVTVRAYPTRADSTAIVLYGTDRATTVQVTAWAMRSAFR